MVTGGKRNRDILLTGDDIGCADNMQSDDGDKKWKLEDHVGDDKFTDSVVSLSRGIDDKGVAPEPCRNEEANGEVTVKASCLEEHFAMTMSFLSAEKAGNTEDHQILDLKRRISRNTDITIHGLRKVLIESEHVEGMFRSCLTLYAMATMLSPVTGTDVDPRYLIPVKGSRNGMIFEKEMLKPVMTWEVSDVKRVVDMVDGLGRWECTNVDVSKRHMWDEENENIRLFDKSTGMKTSVVEDLSDVRSKFSVVKWEDGGLSRIVSDAVMRIMEVNQKRVESDGNGLPDNEAGVESYGDGMPNSLTEIRTPVEFVASPCHTNVLDSTKSSHFRAVAHISQRESYLLTHLFSKNVSADNAFGSNEVARFGGWAVSRWDLSCLSPRQHVTAEERANDISGGVQLDAVVPSTISTYRLQRFVGLLSLCNKIFVPMYDGISNHWFLAVAEMLNGVCEIWDSAPEDSAKTRMHDFAFAAYKFGDQRVCLALEIVNDPRNEILEQVCSVAAEEARDNTPATEVPALCRREDGSLATAGIKFNARRSKR
ncbi:hypothetical protein ACLB2K_031575 [Fragaria x ananassa]